MIQAGRFGAVILAAGAGSRFGGRKLLAPLDGRPVLDHVLGAVRSIGPAETIVVLGHEADDVAASISWSGERRVVNPEPDRGLSSSLQVGFAALGDGIGRDELDGVFVVLGDQPLVDPAVFRALAQAEVRAGTAFVAPRYHAGGANPVLVLRPGRPWIAEATGDRGLGPILAAHPELVAEVELGGTNPDVDTPADLAEIAWADRVRRDREQVDRHREVPDGSDFYRPVTSLFRADPRRTDEPVLDALLALAEPSDTWLDIGAGAGRYALPLALHVREVVAIEPSDGMRTALVELAAEHGIAGVRVIAERWPPPVGSGAATVRADVALIAHLGYDVEAIGPFLDAMEAAAGRLCVAVLMDRQPSSVADPFWPPIHGEERIRLPALDSLVDLLAARGRAPSVARFDRAPRRFASFDELHGFIRRQLWLADGGAKDRQLAGLLRSTAEERDGTWSVTPGPQTVGVASWRPDGG
ncbi:MAG TPA: NTP transferase domain-containing protein [Patescibacteria group bacterium]|nr:NTP transferase domain-containing protein [Patescibacteria group bacterium]